ncbi:MAG TPA: transaldolase [Xanthobacteraceae bacterium]|nr:transaldolase [Xanthobacteraceae bacterium]
MDRLRQLKVKIFADGADFDSIVKLSGNPIVRGFTTNPSLVRKAGVTDYEEFGRKLLAAVPNRPVSLEVFADDFAEMARQARAIATWGPNVNVKIPVTNTKKEFSGDLIRELSGDGVVVNVTAILTLDQVRRVTACLSPKTPAIVSVFAGRIADTGVDPLPLMAEAVSILKARPQAELIWASPRELLNIFQADEIGCHIITVTNDILNKLSLVDKDLEAYSLETVEMFRRDALAAGFTIDAGVSDKRSKRAVA